MSNRKHLLKDGHQVQIFGGEIYTNDNLTDEKAVELLTENAKRADSFETINGSPAAEWDGKFAKADKAPKAEKTAKADKAPKASEPFTKVLTQEDLDADPELAEQVFKVGDTVKPTED